MPRPTSYDTAVDVVLEASETTARPEPTVTGRRRASGALLTNAVSSVGNLSVSVAIAHISNLAVLGHFGVALAIYVLVTGMVRTAVTDTVLTHEHSHALTSRSLRRTVLLGLIAAALVCAGGLVLSQPFVLLLGCALPGIVAYDYVKLVNIGTGVVGRALFQECCWTALTIFFAVLGLTHHTDANGVFAGWVFSCAIIGISHAVFRGYNLIPGWNVDRDETKVGLTFAADFLAGSGIAQITTVTVAAAAGVTVAGALRGAGTILAPLTVVAGTLPSLLIPYLARARRVSADAAVQTSRRLIVIAVALCVPVIALLLLIPSSVGTRVLADNWVPSRHVLPMVAGELLFTIVAAIPFAGHRIERAGVRALTVRLVRAPFQIGAVVASAVTWGATGAAWAMAAVSFVGAVSWWASYRNLLSHAGSLPDVAPKLPTVAILQDSDGIPIPLSIADWGVTTDLRSDFGESSPRRAVPKAIEPQIASSVVARSHAPLSVGTLSRYPVTILLGGQYGAMVAIPAIVHNTQPLGLMLRICFSATLAAFMVEWLIAHRRVGPPAFRNRQPRAISLTATYFVLAVGVVADVGATRAGAGTYQVQVGTQTSSPITSLLTPFTYWELFGAVLVIWAYRQRRITRRRAFVVLAFVAAARLYAGIQTAILAQSLSWLACITILAVFMGLIRFRILLIALLLIPVLWPPLYALRNERRQQFTTESTVSDASGRLRLDIEMATIAQLVPKPSVITTPSVSDLLRFGLLPRAIDSGRATIDTGSQFSVALGGSRTNSQTATALGNAYVFGGWELVVLVPAGIALAMAIAIRRRSPWGFMYVGMLWLYCISFVASYPTMIITMLQASESLGVASAVVLFLSRQKKQPDHSTLIVPARRVAATR